MLKHVRMFLTLMTVSAAAACGGNSNNPSKDPPTATIPNYAGIWDGNYDMTACSQTGEMTQVDLCGLYPVGTHLSHRFEFTQNGRSLTGQFYLGSLLFPFSAATIAEDGSVTVRGTGGDDVVSIVATWTLHLSSGTPNGTVTQSWTSTGLTGLITVNGSTTSTVRGTAAVTPSLARPTTLRGLRDGLRAP